MALLPCTPLLQAPWEGRGLGFLLGPHTPGTVALGDLQTGLTGPVMVMGPGRLGTSARLTFQLGRKGLGDVYLVNYREERIGLSAWREGSFIGHCVFSE